MGARLSTSSENEASASRSEPKTKSPHAASTKPNLDVVMQKIYDQGAADASFQYQAMMEAERTALMTNAAVVCALVALVSYGAGAYSSAARTAAVASKLEAALKRNRTLVRALQRRKARSSPAGSVNEAEIASRLNRLEAALKQSTTTTEVSGK